MMDNKAGMANPMIAMMPGFINERENYYHKPVVNLNWYAQWSKKVTQFTTVYYSGGTGGGTGTYGILYDMIMTRTYQYP